MLWEEDSSSDYLKRLQEPGIESIVFNPCRNCEGGGDFMAIMNRNLENIEQVFRQMETFISNESPFRLQKQARRIHSIDS